jgi:DNA invertase Pin-like site-specific DNA recombinase
MLPRTRPGKAFEAAVAALFIGQKLTARVPPLSVGEVRGGDTIVVWKLDRLARSTRDLLNTMETISEAGGKFQSLSEPWANTNSYVGKMIMTVFAGIAEFERDLIHERTGAGREAAKQRGVQFGRPPKLNPDQVHLAQKLLAEGKAVRDIARTFSVRSPQSIDWPQLPDPLLS